MTPLPPPDPCLPRLSVFAGMASTAVYGGLYFQHLFGPNQRAAREGEGEGGRGRDGAVVGHSLLFTHQRNAVYPN